MAQRRSIIDKKWLKNVKMNFKQLVKWGSEIVLKVLNALKLFRKKIKNGQKCPLSWWKSTKFNQSWPLLPRDISKIPMHSNFDNKETCLGKEKKIYWPFRGKIYRPKFKRCFSSPIHFFDISIRCQNARHHLLYWLALFWAQ